MEEVDVAVARIYAEPPSAFVTARTAMVKDLKAARRKEDAALVSALRRPTKQGWALGEAVRRTPEAASGFFAAVAALGEPSGDLRRRTNDLRVATATLVDAVATMDPGEATAALLAVAADPAALDALRLGRLSEVPSGGGFGGLTLLPEPPNKPERAVDPDVEPGGAATERAAGGDGAGVDEPEPDELPDTAKDAEREQREGEDRARTERIAVLEAERDRAVVAEGTAARRVTLAQTAADEAQAELVGATQELAGARAESAEASQRLRAELSPFSPD